MKATSKRYKLKQVTWVLGDTKTSRGRSLRLRYDLLWCDKVPKGKRSKPAKINGVQHHEISDAIEHVYYQPLR